MTRLAHTIAAWLSEQALIAERDDHGLFIHDVVTIAHALDAGLTEVEDTLDELEWGPWNTTRVGPFVLQKHGRDAYSALTPNRMIEVDGRRPPDTRPPRR